MENKKTIINAPLATQSDADDFEVSKVEDIENFDREKVLEKALLKAFQNEIINITVIKNK